MLLDVQQLADLGQFEAEPLRGLDEPHPLDVVLAELAVPGGCPVGLPQQAEPFVVPNGIRTRTHPTGELRNGQRGHGTDANLWGDSKVKPSSGVVRVTAEAMFGSAERFEEQSPHVATSGAVDGAAPLAMHGDQADQPELGQVL